MKAPVYLWVALGVLVAILVWRTGREDMERANRWRGKSCECEAP
jgi:hypothetical protein